MRADLWGPVETGAASDWFCGAEKGTNNTGELIGIGKALMWLRGVVAKAELVGAQHRRDDGGDAVR